MTQLLVLVPALLGAPWWLIAARWRRRGRRARWPSRSPTPARRGRCASRSGPPGSPARCARSRTSSTTTSPRSSCTSAGPRQPAYQINTWLESLESLDRRVFIVMRDHPLFTKMGSTTIPSLELQDPGELLMLDFSSARVALYPVQHRQQHPPVAAADPDERVHRARRQRQERLQQPVLPGVRRAVGRR